MTPYEDLELSVDPDDDPPRSGMVIVWLAVAMVATIAALLLGAWWVTR